jgi:hypothetical protein
LSIVFFAKKIKKILKKLLTKERVRGIINTDQRERHLREISVAPNWYAEPMGTQWGAS